MNAATRFLSVLVSPYALDPALMLEIRPLWPEWKQGELYPGEEPPWWWRSATGRRQWFYLSAIEAAAQHCLRAAEQSDVYMGVLPRQGRKGGREDVPVAAWLWCDVDGGTGGWEGSVALLKASGLPKPQMAVVSGGGVHAYWQLSEVIDLPDEGSRRQFKCALQRVCLAIGGKSPSVHADSSGADAARILRVPGTWNWKHRERPRRTRLIRCNLDSERFTYDRWCQHLLPREETSVQAMRVSAPLPGHTQAGFVSETLLRWAEKGYPEGNRHKDLASAAAWLIRDCHLTASEAMELLRIKAAHSGGRRAITEDELRAMIRWA